MRLVRRSILPLTNPVSRIIGYKVQCADNLQPAEDLNCDAMEAEEWRDLTKDKTEWGDQGNDVDIEKRRAKRAKQGIDPRMHLLHANLCTS